MLEFFKCNCFRSRKVPKPREYPQTPTSPLQSVRRLFFNSAGTPSGSVQARLSVTFIEPISDETEVRSEELPLRGSAKTIQAEY